MSSPTSSPVSPPSEAPPRWATPRTPGRPTFGPAVAKVSALLGKPFMPWQRLAADVALEVLPSGEWAYPTVVVTVPRQAGKTTLIGPVNVHGGLTTTDGKFWFTAQSRQDARDIYMDIVTLVRRSPLSPHAKVREANGSEAIAFPSGSSLRIFAPGEEALHGKANRRVTVDEAWAFSGAQGAALEQAILPTFTTTAGQLWLVSTAGTAKSEWLKGYVKRGRAAVEAGQTSGICYIEWSIPEDADPNDLDAVLAAHPARGHTLKLSALKAAAAAMSPGDFARAYGNRWTATVEEVIPAELWRVLAAPDAPVPQPGELALALDVGLAGTDASIGAAWRVDDRLHVEVIEHRPGTGWVVPRLRELVETWQPRLVVYDKVGPARAVGDAAELAGLSIQAVTSGELATACASFMAAVDDQALRHIPSEALDNAVASAVQRPMGDAWVWGRRQSTSTVSPLVTVTLAGWALDHAPPPPTPFKIL